MCKVFHELEERHAYKPVSMSDLEKMVDIDDLEKLARSGSLYQDWVSAFHHTVSF